MNAQKAEAGKKVRECQCFTKVDQYFVVATSPDGIKIQQ